MSDKRANRQAHTPLFKLGFTEISEDELESVFTQHEYDTSRRRFLSRTLRLFVAHLRKLGIKGELWIDGSFTTRNPNPKDVDIGVVVSPTQLVSLPQSSIASLSEMATEEGRASVKNRWSVDVYVIDASDFRERRYWIEFFSRNPEAEAEKGIPFIKL